MTPDDVLSEMRAAFPTRRYVGGLLIAFAEFLKEIGTPGKGFGSLDDLFVLHPQVTAGTSTLTIQYAGGQRGQKTIRPAYERAHQFFIFENKRIDYPRSQPYATGKWADYRQWLDAMVTFTGSELDRIVDETKAFVLDQLPARVFDATSVRVDPPIFLRLLREFSFENGARAARETTGAAFQAAVFGYIRADSPHLQVEARKVRTGSARLKGIGDIDAWEGDQLVISAEVKSFKVGIGIEADREFFSGEVRQRGALGMVVALDFGEAVRGTVAALGVTPLSLKDLVRVVALWDPLKQRAALNAFLWVVKHIEQNTPLIERVDAFLRDVGYVLPLPAVEATVTSSDEQ